MFPGEDLGYGLLTLGGILLLGGGLVAMVRLVVIGFGVICV